MNFQAKLFHYSRPDPFSSALPGTNLYTPAALQFTAYSRPDVVVITNTGGIRQVNAPQALADVIVINTNAYQVNFYYASQVGTFTSGLYPTTGSPYVTWTITNSNPSTINQVQISETGLGYGLMKQWTYNYDPGTGIWSVQSLGGLIQENRGITTVGTNSSQIVNSIQAPSGPVVQQVAKTYQTFSWGTALVQIALGSSNAPELTTYTYNDTSYGPGAPAPVHSVTHPDGSWQYYNGYDTSGKPADVYSSFGDATITTMSNARRTIYDYTTYYVGGSGDDGTISTNTPRMTIVSVQGTEVSRSYSAFPSVGERIDIQCAVTGAAWNDPANLYTTNFYYTSGANQFALQSVIRPDKTMTTYNYLTNSTGTYQTNITATGQPDSTFSYIVDGTTNWSVVDQFGNAVLNVSADIKSGIITAQDTYGNFDGYGRPQQVTHLDGATEYMTYACCGLESTTDRDGVVTDYLYDAANRQFGYTRNGITYTNLLDAAGRTLQSVRVGTNGSPIVLSQSQYDLASELISQTNALNGVTSYTRTNDPTTGALIRTTVYPDLGTATNFYYVDGSLKQTLGTAVRPMSYLEGVDSYGLYTTTVKLTASLGTNEWTETDQDALGRSYQTIYASASGTPKQIFNYNSLGQLTNTVDPDEVSTIYAYNAKGERNLTILDMTRTGTDNFNASNHITFTTNDVVTVGGTNVIRSQTYVWSTSSTSSNLISTVESSTDGLKRWSIAWNNGVGLTNFSQTVYGSSGHRYVTNTAPDASYTVSTYQYGQLLSVVRKDAGNNQISGTTYAYEPHGRQNTATDARNSTTTYYFNNADQISGTITPSPDGILSGEVTTNYFDALGRITSTTLPDNTSVNNQYYTTGDRMLTYGSRTYPVGYGYDAQGRMKTMTNWSSFASSPTARVTTWTYDAYRGFLASKTYDGVTQGPSYTNTAAGRLLTRLWARGTNTTYSYDNAGSLSTVTYNDGSTPSLGYGYDRRGRQTAITNGATVCNLAYNDQNQVLSESYSGGPLNGLTVTNIYDSLLRRTTNGLWNGSAWLTQTRYTYGAASRLLSVSDGTNSGTYSYIANSPLVSQIAFTNSGAWRMTTTKNYDYLNRLTSISSANASSVVLDSHAYSYNSANQRTAVTNTDSSYWSYQYRPIGPGDLGR